MIRALGESGVTVLLSSHILAEVQQVCHSVSIIGNGRLMASGRVDDLVGADSVRSFRVSVADPTRRIDVLKRAGYRVKPRRCPAGGRGRHPAARRRGHHEVLAERGHLRPRADPGPRVTSSRCSSAHQDDPPATADASPASTGEAEDRREAPRRRAHPLLSRRAVVLLLLGRRLLTAGRRHDALGHPAGPATEPRHGPGAGRSSSWTPRSTRRTWRLRERPRGVLRPGRRCHGLRTAARSQRRRLPRARDARPGR